MSLRVETSGAGPDLVLLHGWGLGAGAWDCVLPALAERFRVHRVSLPGYDGTPDDGGDFRRIGLAPPCKAMLARSIALTSSRHWRTVYVPSMASVA